MAEIEQFSNTQTQEQQSEYLKSINQSMTRLVDVTERSTVNSSSQFFQGNAVQSTVANMRDISYGAYSRFEDDLVSARQTGRSVLNRVSETGHTVSGTVQELKSHAPTITPLSPMSSTGFFGTTAAYSTNYRSTFWNDLWGGYLGDRAPQTMFQEDFRQTARENLSTWRPDRVIGRGLATLAGADLGLDEDVIAANLATSQRYTRAGTSRALSGVGSTRGEIIGVVERERGKMLDQLGYNYDDFQASKQIFAAGGQFIGTKSELERSNVAFQGMGQAEVLAKALAVPIQEAARAMMDVRSQLGITSLAGQSNFIMQSQALGMASGLNFQEVMGGALAGAGLARNLGFNVRAGGTIGRDVLTSVNAAYLDRAVSENLVQSAGGVQNLSQNLASSAINFATGTGSMYYLASMQGGQFNQQAFNQSTGGFAQLGAMAASNVSTVQGYANFIANKDSIESQGGSFNVMAMQRAHMNNIFKSATGRDFTTDSTEDTNMMKMLAASSGIFTDPTTAKAFVEMNFTEAGQDSMYAAQRDAYKAEKQLKYKAALDQRFKSNSVDAIARSISNVWNKPAQGLRGWFNDTFEDFGGRDAEREKFMWATGQMPLGTLSQEDVSEFGKAGGFSREVTSGPIAGSTSEAIHDPGMFARTTTGAYQGMVTGAKIGGAISTAATVVGVAGMGTLWSAGALFSGTGIGAAIGIPLLAAAAVGTAAGAIFGAASVPEPINIPGLDNLKNPDKMAEYNQSVKAWNRGGGFSKAEKNTMADPDFQKKIVAKLMDKGMGVHKEINEKNTIAYTQMAKEVADEMGISESMVANIAQTKMGVSGSPLYGAELAWAQVGSQDMFKTGEELEGKFKDIFGNKYKELVNDSEFTGKLGTLLSAGGDSAERAMSGEKFLSKFGSSLDEKTRSKIDQYIRTGGIEDREDLAGMLTKRSLNLRSQKIQENISGMFGARAKDESFADVADQFEQIANASSPAKQVGMVLANLQDDKFKSALERDPSLKRLLPLEGPIDKSMLSDAEAFKQRFKMGPMDDLKNLQKLFDDGGEDAVRARIAGGIISAQAKGDQAMGKQNEAQMLSDAASTFKDAALIIQQMKGK
jgi:hypothetical protein